MIKKIIYDYKFTDFKYEMEKSKFPCKDNIIEIPVIQELKDGFLK